MQTAVPLRAFAVTCVSHCLIVLIFRSCAPHQWQPVQLGARAPLRQTDQFRVLGRLGGPLRVQSRLPAERIQCHPLPGHARCPRTVELNSADLYRYGFQSVRCTTKVTVDVGVAMLQQTKQKKTKIKMTLEHEPLFHQTHCPPAGNSASLRALNFNRCNSRPWLPVMLCLNYPKLGSNIPTCLLAM